MLQLCSEHLLKVYKGRAVVNDVSVQVSQGEIVGLLGPNGAGKTTSFYQIVGLIPPDSGKIFLGDREITDQPMYMRAQLGIGYLPQEASVFRHLSVEDNIAAVLEMTHLTKEQQKTRLENLLNEFGLNRVRRSMGNVLSGGERRRTEIARALATDPKFILLDEPFAGIDPIAVEDIQRIVIKLKQKNIGVLITDHNVQETLSITDRAYLLFEGKILKAGTAEELAEDEQVRKVYLGQNFVLHRKDVMLSENAHEQELNVGTALKYTTDLLTMANDISDKLKHGTPYHSINDFARSLTEYLLSVNDFVRKQNLTSVQQRLSGLTIKSAGSDWKVTVLELSGGLLQRLLEAENWSDYFTQVKNELQKIENEFKQLLSTSTK